MRDILAPLWSASTSSTSTTKWTATKERLKNVERICPCPCTRSHSFLESVLTVFIVHLFLFRIAQNIVSLSNFFELFGVTTFVRVMFDGLLSVCLFDLIGRGILVQSKKFVKLRVVGPLGRSHAEHGGSGSMSRRPTRPSPRFHDRVASQHWCRSHGPWMFQWTVLSFGVPLVAHVHGLLHSAFLWHASSTISHAFQHRLCRLRCVRITCVVDVLRGSKWP
mmetsp:Transcript_9739/g.59163  ORF Transcript_9739/g.59163 Transcript_9739/m.59163 type:complete len:221 (+) Transcript_9739:1781-2443(+)